MLPSRSSRTAGSWRPRLPEGEEKDGQGNPAGDLDERQHDGHDETRPRPTHEASRSLPVANRNEDRDRCRDHRQIKEKQGIDGEGQGDSVVERALGLEGRELAFSLLPFETVRTHVPAPELDVAQGAEKAPAGVTRQDGPFSGVIEAAGIPLRDDAFGGRHGESDEVRREDVDAQPGPASFAELRLFDVPGLPRHGPEALAARDLPERHSRSNADDARVADAVVERTLLFVECR